MDRFRIRVQVISCVCVWLVFSVLVLVWFKFWGLVGYTQ